MVYGNSTYTCTVKDVREVSSNGRLDKSNGFMTHQIGTKFTINKETGEISGKYVNTLYSVSREVLDIGGHSNNYKTLSIYEPNRQIMYIEVMDNIEVARSPIPFIGYRLSSVFSGVCN